MHYNPFAYIHSEKDILKLVTALISNTKGEGKGNDPFWEKAETLLYTALIGYIHYEAPKEEQNFATMIEFINAFEVSQMTHVTHSGPGQGLIIYDNVILPFVDKFPTDIELYKLLTTTSHNYLIPCGRRGWGLWLLPDA